MTSVPDLKHPPGNPPNVSLAVGAESGTMPLRVASSGVTIDHRMYPHIMDLILDYLLDEVDREEEEWARQELVRYLKNQLILRKWYDDITGDGYYRSQDSKDGDENHRPQDDKDGDGKLAAKARPSAWSAWWGLRCSSRRWHDRLDAMYRHIMVDTLHYAPRFLCPRTARRLPGLRWEWNDPDLMRVNERAHVPIEPPDYGSSGPVRHARTKALLARVRVVDAPRRRAGPNGPPYVHALSEAMAGLEIRRQPSLLWGAFVDAPTVVMMLSLHNLKSWPHVGRTWDCWGQVSNSVFSRDTHTLVLNLRYFAGHKRKSLWKSGWGLRGTCPKNLVIMLSPHTIPPLLQQCTSSPALGDSSSDRESDAADRPDSDEGSDHELDHLMASRGLNRPRYRCFLDMFRIRHILAKKDYAGDLQDDSDQDDSERPTQTVTIVGADELDPAWFRLPHTLSWEERKKALIDGWRLSDDQHKRLEFVSRTEYQARVGTETYAYYTTSSLPIPDAPDGPRPVESPGFRGMRMGRGRQIGAGFTGCDQEYLFTQGNSPSPSKEPAWLLPIPPTGTRVPAKSTSWQ